MTAMLLAEMVDGQPLRPRGDEACATPPPTRRGVLLDSAPIWAYGLPPSALEMSAIASWARTLLPAASTGGEITAMPNLPGETAMMPPPTPLLAGRPVLNSHLPASS